MKRVFAMGSAADAEKICEVFRSINAEAASFLSVESLLAEAGKSAPHLVISAFELASKSEMAVQEIRQSPALKGIPVLVYYPSFTIRPESRAQAIGAEESLLFPVERRELLSKSSRLLRIEKRRQFKTLLTVEAVGRSLMAQSDDFSTTGLSFHTDGLLQEEEKVRIHLFLPGEPQRISLEAAIARRFPMPDGLYFYGARFSATDTASLRKIEEFIDKRR